jgi:hypothetical protein
MEKKNQFLFLIENSLEKLSKKYSTPFKYEFTNSEKDNICTFKILQGDETIYSKSVHYIKKIDSINYFHYMIVRDFFIDAVEQSFMMKKDQSKINITIGKW